MKKEIKIGEGLKIIGICICVEPKIKINGNDIAICENCGGVC